MSDVFSIIKENIDTKDVAVHYGFHPNRSGLICCPFHNDKSPSMKVDKRYYCFGCGATGDVIDFVKNLFELPVMEAAKKIAHDFGIRIDGNDRTSAEPVNAETVNVKPINKSKISKNNCEIERITRILNLYIDYLKVQIQKYEPKSMDEEWDDRFVDTQDKLTKSKYLLDGLLFGTRDDIEKFYEDSKEEVEEIEQRFIEIEKSRNKRITSIKR